MKKQLWAKLLVFAMVLTMLPVAALGAAVEPDEWVKSGSAYVLDGDTNYVLADDTALSAGIYNVTGDADDATLTLYKVALDADAELTIKNVELKASEGNDAVYFTVKKGAKLTLDGVSADKAVYLISEDADDESVVLKGTFNAGVYELGEDTAIATGEVDTKWPAKTVTPSPSPAPGGAAGTGGSTSVKENEDGSTTTTMTTTAGKGVTTVPAADATEGVTTADVELKSSAVNSAARTGKAVELPVPALTATNDSATAPVVNITVPASVASKSFKVSVPLTGDALDGVVPVIVTEDGEEVVRVSMAQDGKLVFAVEGNVTVKLVDKSIAFTDVADNYWAAKAVDFASARELFRGTSDTTFAPAMEMSRSMMATVLYRLVNEPEVVAEGNVFEDVADGTWYTEATVWAAEAKIVEGKGEGIFDPNANITRAELVTMIYRFAQYVKVEGESKALDEFSDADQVADWASEAMAWCVGSGIINGRANGEVITLDPTANASRAEVVTIIHRLVGLMLK